MSLEQKLQQSMDLNLRLQGQLEAAEGQATYLTKFLVDLKSVIHQGVKQSEEEANQVNLKQLVIDVTELKKAQIELEQLKGAKPSNPAKRPAKKR